MRDEKKEKGREKKRKGQIIKKYIYAKKKKKLQAIENNR